MLLRSTEIKERHNLWTLEQHAGEHRPLLSLICILNLHREKRDYERQEYDKPASPSIERPAIVSDYGKWVEQRNENLRKLLEVKRLIAEEMRNK